MKYVAVAMALGLLTMTGCQTSPFQKSDDPPVELLDDKTSGEIQIREPGLIPAMARRFRDVPLPQGLREDTDRSFVYDSKSTQVARMVYFTKDSLSDLAQFYIRQAPNEGWKLVSTTQVDKSVNLLFSKPGRRLDVKASRQGVGRSNQLVILYLPEDGAS